MGEERAQGKPASRRGIEVLIAQHNTAQQAPAACRPPLSKSPRFIPHIEEGVDHASIHDQVIVSDHHVFVLLPARQVDQYKWGGGGQAGQGGKGGLPTQSSCRRPHPAILNTE